MELLDFLRTIRSDPNDASSPPLWAVRDELKESDRDIILGSYYQRRPYAIVQGLPGNREITMHDGSGSFTRLIDIVIIQPAQENGDPFPRANIDAVWMEAQSAQWETTNIQGLPIESLSLEVEVPPADRYEKPGEREGVLRFRARYQRLRPGSGVDLNIGHSNGPVYNANW